MNFTSSIPVVGRMAVFSSLALASLSFADFAKADQTLTGAIYSTDAVLTPSNPNVDYWIYEESSPGNLTRNDGANLQSILQGYAGASGGNVELFPQSETAAYVDGSATGAFANAAPVTLSGTAGSAAFSFRSLNGNDWFGSSSGYNVNYGAATLATTWFDQFIDSVISKTINPAVAEALDANRAALFQSWYDAGGFSSLSDANVGYVYQSASGELNFGLEGFYDASPRFRQFLTDAGYGFAVPFVPDGIQYSEVVLLNGEAYYSFEAVPSGVQLDDAPFNSYTGTFEFAVVPEPGAALMASLSVMGAMLRRRRHS